LPDEKAKPFAHWETMLPWFESGRMPDAIRRQKSAGKNPPEFGQERD
jgi:hypothetical protein